MAATRTSGSTRVGAAALISVALVAAACGGSSSTGADGSRDPSAVTEVSDDAPDVTEVTDVGDVADGAVDEPDGAAAPVVSEGQIEEDVVEADAAPVPGGTLRYGLEADVSGLNPTTSALSAPGLVMGNAVFDTLMAIDVGGNPVPYLAESIEPVEGDLARWRVTIRDGVTFHDGVPLTAEAVQANFEAQLSSPLVGLALRPFFPAAGATTVIDARTIEYAMLEPNATFPALLTGQVGMVASPDWLTAAAADATLNQEPVGTGPFVFDSRSQDSVTRFVRNDAWWGGEVFLDAVEFLPVTDPATRNDLLFGGEIEALQTTDSASVGDLRDDDSVQNVVDETGEEQFVMLNTAMPPFDDIRARQALALATPLSSYRFLIGLDIARGADQMFIPESKFYNPDVVQQGDDPAAAVELAAAYCADVPEGCSGGKINIEYKYPGGSVLNVRAAEVLTEGWSSAFNVAFQELVQDELILQVVLGQYQASLFRQFGGLEPSANRHLLMCRTITDGISLNITRYCSEERDALILDAMAQTDPDARVMNWQAISQDMNDVVRLHLPAAHHLGQRVRPVGARRLRPHVARWCCVAMRRERQDLVRLRVDQRLILPLRQPVAHSPVAPFDAHAARVVDAAMWLSGLSWGGCSALDGRVESVEPVLPGAPSPNHVVAVAVARATATTRLSPGYRFNRPVLEPGGDRDGVTRALGDVVDATFERAVGEHVVDHTAGGDDDAVAGLLDAFDVTFQRALVHLPDAAEVGGAVGQRFIASGEHRCGPVVVAAGRCVGDRDVGGSQRCSVCRRRERRRLVVLATLRRRRRVPSHPERGEQHGRQDLQNGSWFHDVIPPRPTRPRASSISPM